MRLVKLRALAAHVLLSNFTKTTKMGMLRARRPHETSSNFRLAFSCIAFSSRHGDGAGNAFSCSSRFGAGGLGAGGSVRLGQPTESDPVAVGTGRAGHAGGSGEAANRKMEDRFEHQAQHQRRRGLSPAQPAKCASGNHCSTASFAGERWGNFQALPQSGCAFRRLRAGGRVGGSVRLQRRIPIRAKRSSAIERSRRELAERMETLATSKEGELTQLRTQVRDLQAAAAPPPVAPKKVVVDDNEPAPKKVVKKKTVPKPPKPSPSTTTPTSSTTTTS